MNFSRPQSREVTERFLPTRALARKDEPSSLYTCFLPPEIRLAVYSLNETSWAGSRLKAWVWVARSVLLWLRTGFFFICIGRIYYARQTRRCLRKIMFSIRDANQPSDQETRLRLTGPNVCGTRSLPQQPAELIIQPRCVIQEKLQVSTSEYVNWSLMCLTDPRGTRRYITPVN